MELWIVGQVKSPDGKVWEFQGVFGSEELAVAACKGPDWFVGPAVLNNQLASEPIQWPGCFRPIKVES